MNAPLPYWRITIERWDDEFLYAAASPEANGKAKVRYAFANAYGDWAYLKDVLFEGAKMNIVCQKKDEDADCWTGELYIFEPDFLLHISATAGCVDSRSPYSFFYKLFCPPAGSNPYILLGNFASQLLDEALRHPDAPLPYKESAQEFFRHNLVDILASDEFGQLHKQAQTQCRNIRTILYETERKNPAFSREKAVLEPSFFCEMLGLQGRMDLLQEDFRVLVEQKSGQCAFPPVRHRTEHYVQMLLYRAILHFAFGCADEEISSYLLYSKYPNGMLKEDDAPSLLGLAFEMRNRIVRLFFDLAKGDFSAFENLQPDDFWQRPDKDNVIWTRYERPRIEEFLQVLRSASPLSHAYFRAFWRFLEGERLAACYGSEHREADGTAALWSATLEEKRGVGSILCPLHIDAFETESIGGETVYTGVRLASEERYGSDASNFRLGDGAILYAYTDADAPDCRRAIIIRGEIVALGEQRVDFRFRFPQHSDILFRGREEASWAIEHDIASAFSSAYRALFESFAMPFERRQWFFGEDAPRHINVGKLHGDYGDLQPLVESVQSTDDYFLVIGPPGTGKTSHALMSILKENLAASPDANILLCAYTNRAVDEICSNLLKANLTFVRIGRDSVCDEAYRPYLIENKFASLSKKDEMLAALRRERIVVGTTHTLASQTSLFVLKHFALAIVDEASQLLEHQILPLLTATSPEGTSAIERFVFIGDHKQLPAVVRQTEEQAGVESPKLRAASLLDMRQSLFERLLRLQHERFGDAAVFQLCRQGRMHPDVAQFPAQRFYGGHLLPLGLPHQNAELEHVSPENSLENLLATKRNLFFAVKSTSAGAHSNANAEEAACIAQVVASLCRIWQRSSRVFDGSNVGIIVPYRTQISLLRIELEEAAMSFPEELREQVKQAFRSIIIDTVERFQGSQREIIVYGLTVSRPSQLNFLCSTQFVDENGSQIDRKLNVALTRAREQCILVGNTRVLSQDPVHRSLLQDYQTRGQYFSYPLETR